MFIKSMKAERQCSARIVRTSYSFSEWRRPSLPTLNFCVSFHLILFAKFCQP